MQQKLFRPPKIYCLDANVFIALKNYPSDVFKTLWANFETLVKEEILISDEEVYNELSKGRDVVSRWIKRNKGMFKLHTEEVFAEIKGILQKHPTIVDVDKEGFDADPFLIAQARLHGAVLVTQEKPKKVGSTIDKIPDVCKTQGVRHIDAFTMFRELKWKF